MSVSCLIDPDQDPSSFQVEKANLHQQAPVVDQVCNLILPCEAEYLISKAYDVGLSRSTVIGADGKSHENEARTSHTAFLPKNKDKVISCIENRIAHIAGQDVSYLEPLQVTQYQEGQEYRPHHDWFNDKEPGDGQRTKTVFAYLKGLENDGGTVCGGATAFPKLQDFKNEILRVYPTTGCAAMWTNTTEDGKGDINTLHGGEKVLCEGATKIGLNAWFRDTPWE